MQIGVVFPQTEYGSDRGLIRDYAQTAEALGYSHILAYDHVLGAEHARREPPFEGPYTEETTFHEPLVLFGFMAGVTERIGFMTGVLILPQRQAALAAKQAAEVALLAGPGRLRLGLGIGWNYVEYESLGVPYRRRGPRMEEQVEVMRRLWTEPVVDFTGKFHRVDRAGLRPLLGAPIPIWFGGFSDAALDRAARIGDGFVFGRVSSLALNAIAKVRAAAAASGRDPAAIGFESQVQYPGGPDEWLTRAGQWRAAGGTHLSLNTMGAGLASPQEHLDAIRRYREALEPWLK